MSWLYLLQIQPGQRILDVGCGAGDDVRALAERVGKDGQVVGIDSSATMVRTAQERAVGADLPVEFRQGDVTKLDLPSASFDGVRAE